MSKQYDYENFPAYAIMYIVYGFDSNLTDDDIQNINSWLKRERLQNAEILFVGENHYFSNIPCFGLPCDCVDISFIDYNRNKPQTIEIYI